MGGGPSKNPREKEVGGSGKSEREGSRGREKSREKEVGRGKKTEMAHFQGIFDEIRPKIVNFLRSLSLASIIIRFPALF